MRKIRLTCQNCGIQFELDYRKRLLENRKYCSRSCSIDAIVSSGKFRGENNPMYGKTIRTKATHPEWAAKISASSKALGRMHGAGNPMKDPVVAARMSKTRRERVTSSIEYRTHMSRKMREAWMRGVYDGAAVGKCKWYDHVDRHGFTHKLQGTWELRLAQFFDVVQIDYVSHRDRVSYIDIGGVTRSYYPDFYVPLWESYVDVKGRLWDDLQRQKIASIRKSNPDLRLIILTRDRLKNIGVDLKASSPVRDER